MELADNKKIIYINNDNNVYLRVNKNIKVNIN